MAYHKRNINPFQAAQQGVVEAQSAYADIVKDSSDYGTQLKHVKQEVNEAYQQIENALETASEHQYEQLKRYQEELGRIVADVNADGE